MFGIYRETPVTTESEMASRPGRSYEEITLGDLTRLGQIARLDRQELFAKKPRYRVLGERLICVVLCQGAARHFIDDKNGVKDFDIWTFFAAHPDAPDFPWRRRKARAFGNPRFGPSPDKPGFVGRHVDLLGRSIEVAEDDDPISVLRTYLSEGGTETACRLSEKAVVLLEPADRLGTVVWPIGYQG